MLKLNKRLCITNLILYLNPGLFVYLGLINLNKFSITINFKFISSILILLFIFSTMFFILRIIEVNKITFILNLSFLFIWFLFSKLFIIILIYSFEAPYSDLLASQFLFKISYIWSEESFRELLIKLYDLNRGNINLTKDNFDYILNYASINKCNYTSFMELFNSIKNKKISNIQRFISLFSNKVILHHIVFPIISSFAISLLKYYFIDCAHYTKLANQLLHLNSITENLNKIDNEMLKSLHLNKQQLEVLLKFCLIIAKKRIF